MALDGMLLPLLSPPSPPSTLSDSISTSPIPLVSSSGASISTTHATPTFSVDVQHAMHLRNEDRIGDGCLDYFISQSNASPMIVLSIHKAKVPEEENDEDDYFEDERRTNTFRIRQIESWVESDIDDFKHSLARLFAQMLDALHLEEEEIQCPRKRKLTTSASSPPSTIRFVKGILSTAQNFMFFSMRKDEKETKPQLDYYGRLRLNFLPKRAGLTIGLANLTCPVDTKEVVQLVKAFHFFTSYDGAK